MNEWTFTSNAASTINEILARRPDLPFARAEVERSTKGSRKRSDLTLWDRAGQRALMGEVKMPDNPEGRSAIQAGLVEDAHTKANASGVEYFFTWNVNSFVLWKTFRPNLPLLQRDLQRYNVLPSPARTSEDADHPLVQKRIGEFLERFLGEFAEIRRGAAPMPSLPLDAKFIELWEETLRRPVVQTLQALADRHGSDAAFTVQLNTWMREKQGWTLSDEEETLRDNLERAAKLSCYVLGNKIIFYKALRRRFPEMRELIVPTRIKTGEQLQALLREHFDHAITVSGDYETVFTGDFGDRLPFLDDAATASWRDLAEQTDGFDFTQIDYEVIGQIFERMLSVDERHKFGQHYTRSEVVDLINAFCIREPDASVLDPACGGGTFLVRAYARKRALSHQQLGHQDLIDQIHGFDISAYPVHLTTINLATRDLVNRANYPLVAQHDFFDVSLNQRVFRVPPTVQPMPRVDAVVGNPPYVRQEKISEYYGAEYKQRLRELALREARGVELTGRSDIHCYFFPHALSFLKEGGYIGLLVSSTWLDTGYGFRLQEFLLDNFEILAIFESNCEPWFTGARVTTSAVILRQQSDPQRREENRVKFVWLSRPLAELFGYDASEEERRRTFEAVRDRVEAMTGDEEFQINPGDGDPVPVRQETLDGWRARIIRQGDLRRLGCLPFVAGDEEAEADEETSEPEDEPENDTSPAVADGAEAIGANAARRTLENAPTVGSDYSGYKWGIFLRAPDIFFKLLRRGGSAFVPLGKIAEIKRGVTSGCDKFFFPRDITGEEVARLEDETEFRQMHGFSPEESDRIRIIRAGDGSVHDVEAEYLIPAVFNLMEIDSVEIRPQQLRKQMLLVSKPKDKLKGTRALQYINWGESEGFHLRPTCANRPRWYALSSSRPRDVVWSKSQQYRHIVPHNTDGLIVNCNLYDVWGQSGVDAQLLCAALNSTVTALSKHFFGRIAGREGNLKTEVVDTKMMLVPDPRQASPEVRRKLKKALKSLSKRTIGRLVDVDSEELGASGELARMDRRELDDTVLEMIGVADPEERRRLREELYAEITKLYRDIRIAERKMQEFRSQTARRGRITPQSVANEVWNGMEPKPPFKTPLDFAPVDDAEEVNLPAGQAKVVDDLFHPRSVEVAGHYIALTRIARAEFVAALSECGLSGPVRVPRDPEVCEVALQSWQQYRDEVTERFTTEAAARTADEAMQRRIVAELWRKLQGGRR